MSTKKSVVITGASTGIGWAAAKMLLEKGFRVFGTVRKQADADRLSATFGPDFVPLLMDVTDQAAVQAAAAKVGELLGKERLAGLVNNAGIAVSGPMLHLPPEELRWQMEVNLIAPMVVTQAFAPLLGSDKGRSGAPGRIVQISSVSGHIGFPFLGAYVASKFALEGMSESLRRELLLYGIDVIVIGPGAVVTPIWDKADDVDFGKWGATDYGKVILDFKEYMVAEGKKGLPAEDIARAIWTALTVKKPKVRYAVVPQRFKNWTLPKLLPKRVLDRLVGKQLGFLK